MDVCTLIVSQLMTLQGCLAPPVCRMSEDGTKQLCTGWQGIACQQPPPFYECVRPDGTTYSLKQSEAK